jgi:zinc/manganese transport system permease protein
MTSIFVVGVGGFLGQPFLQHAVIAGALVSFAAGLAGYLLALRAETFTSDAFEHAAYTGALGALAFGFDPSSACSPPSS